MIFNAHDEKAEAMAEALFAALEKSGIAIDGKAETAVDNLMDLLGNAYHEGYQDGMADEAMARECQPPKIYSVEEISAFLNTQANLRAQENDEAGILLRLRDEWIKDLLDLDPKAYANLA